MDILLQRYNSPFEYLTMLIRTCGFSRFVGEFMKIINNEKEDRLFWEFYLHKVFDGSFDDFKKGFEIRKKNQRMSTKEMESTVAQSLSILSNVNSLQ